MAKFIKNASGAQDTWAGQIIADGAYYEVPKAEWITWQTDDQVIGDIGSGDLIVARDDSGTTDYASVAEGLSYFLDADPTPRDSDGSPITNTKHTKTGWHYEPRSLDFCTGKYLSLYNRKHDGFTIGGGTDYGDAYLKFYRADGTEMTYQETGHETEDAPTFQTRLDTECVRTIMDWQPTYDMDIIGGVLMIRDAPTADTYMWTIVAPDIPEVMGGQVPHVAGGWNLSYFNSKDKIIVNGRGSKTVVYDPIYNSNKFRTVVKHAAGANIGIQMIYEHFKA